MKSKKLDINNWSVKSLLIIFFFLLISIVVLWKFVLSNHKVEASWWNDGWNYRKAISINNSGVPQTNTQIKILNNYDLSALVTAGKLQADLDDLRFTDINGNLIKYWIEDSTNNSVDVWGFIPSIPTSGATVYMYYGNPSITNGETIVGTKDNPGLSCKAVKLSNGTFDNIYYIDPTGGNVADAIQIFCDLNTDSGGWMLIGKSDSTIYTHAPGFFSDGNIPTKINRGSINVFNMSLVDNSAEWMWQDTVNSQYVKFSLTKYSTIKTNPDSYTKTNDDTGQRFISSTITSASSLYQFTAVGNSQVPVNAGNFSYATSASSYGSWGNAYYAGGLQSNARAFIISNYGGHEGAYGLYGLQRYNPSPYIATNSVMMVRESAFSIDSNFSSTFAAEEAGGGPVAYWKFDEGTGTTAYDSTTNQNNGTISGATWQTEDMCISGECLSFDGNNDYINIGTIKHLPTFTLGAWIKAGTDVSDFRTILDKTIGANDRNFWLALESGTGQLSLRFSIAGTSTTYLANTALNDNKWHYVTATYDNSYVKLYVDGKPDMTPASKTGTPDTAITTSIIGYEPVISSRFFKGLIDEPKIYPYARTAAQIKLDYNSRGSSKGTSSNLGGAASDNNLSDGLVGYWKMDEGVGTTTADSSGNSNTGTLSGTSWGTGKFGVGASFNGSSSISIPHNSILKPSSYISISTWIKPTDITSTSYSEIYRKEDGNDRHLLSFQSSGTILSFGIGTATQGYQELDVPITASDYTNGWHLITAVYDGQKKYLYKDGILIGSQVATGALGTSGTATAYIGSNLGTGEFFNGLIDEVRLYNRALSPAEVSQLYNYAPGPVGYWNFEENTGTVAKDKSGNNNTGTLGTGNSAPTWSSGKYGSSLNFNGTSQFVSITSLSAAIQAYGTFEIWFKPNDCSAANQSIFSQRYTGWHGRGIVINSNTISGWSRNSSGTWQSVNLGSCVNNQWYHAVLTQEGNIIKGYLNGIFKNSFDMASSLDGSYLNYYTLGKYTNDNYFFNGKIDEVKIYNYARTQKQIIEDMNGGAPATSSKSMIGYWKFDEGSGTTVNNSGNGGSALNGTLGTGPSAPTWSNDGKFNKALNFNGVNNYIQGSTSSLLKPTNITISAWAKTSDSKSTQFIGGYGNTGVLGYWLGAGSSKFVFSVGNGSSNKQLSSNFTSNDNNWHHVVGTYDGSTQKIFVDGNLKNTYTAVTGDISYGTLANGFLIGNTEGLNSARFWSGSIDDVKIYNYALTDDEVKQDYNQGSALQMGQTSQTISGTTTNLEYCIPGDASACSAPVAEWNFEENTGSTTKDSSGNNNTGTVGTGSSAPTWTIGKKNTGAGLKFDGINDKVTTNFNIGTTEFTVECYFKVDNFSATEMPLITQYDGSSTRFLLTINSNSGYKLRPFIGGVALWGTTNLVTNKWYHVVFNRYTNGNTNLYLNGILEAGTTMTTGTPPQVGLMIGSVSNSSYYFNGTIDNVKIYNYARTPAQVAYDYNKGGPIGWWKLDECQGSVANDSSGIGNTGSINISASGTQTSVGTCTASGTAWGNGASGKINGSLNFDGTDDTIILGKQTGLNGVFTASAWFKRKGSAGGGYHGIINSITGDTPYTRILIESAGASIILQQRDSTSSVIGGTWNNQPFGDNNWHHIVYLFDGSFIKLYTDGKLQGSPYACNGVISSSGILEIGRGQSNSYFSNGQIDDVRIYNYALTTEQVKTLYNGGAVSFN